MCLRQEPARDSAFFPELELVLIPSASLCTAFYPVRWDGKPQPGWTALSWAGHVLGCIFPDTRKLINCSGLKSPVGSASDKLCRVDGGLKRAGWASVKQNVSVQSGSGSKWPREWSHISHILAGSKGLWMTGITGTMIQLWLQRRFFFFFFFFIIEN